MHIHLHGTTIFRPQLEYCVQVWVPQFKRDRQTGVDPEERTRMVMALKNLSYEKRLKELGMFKEEMFKRLWQFCRYL